VKLPTGDSSFFPTYFTTEHGKSLLIEPISLIKDHELRRRIDDAVACGPGLSIVLGAPDLYKAMAIVATNAHDQMFEIAGFIFDKDPEFIGSVLTLAEIVEVIMSCLYEATDGTDADRVAEGDVWTFARLIDFFGKEYSWTITDIMGMSRHQLKTVLNAVEERHKEEEEALEDSRSDRQSGLAGAESRMNNTKLLHRVKGRGSKRKLDKDADHPSAEPDWDKSEGSNSLLMFATTLGIPIKQEGNV